MVPRRVIPGLIIFGLVLAPLLGSLPLVAAYGGTSAAATPGVTADARAAAAFPDFEHLVIDDNPPATYRITDIQIGDISGDGLPDVWTTGLGDGASANQMVWYKNPSWSRYEISPGDFMYGDLGDLDDDGDLDIVAGQQNDDRVYWFENTADRELGDWPKSYLGVSPWPDLIFIEDIDKDGRPDVVYLYKDAWGWARNPADPKNTWSDYSIWSGEKRTGGSLADVDRDSDLDVVYGNAWFENPLPGGDPTLGSQWEMRDIDPGWTTEARSAVGDLNGDDRPDVVLSGEEDESGVAWYIAPADLDTGTWTKRVVVDSGYDGVHSLDLADFDLDGDLDIFAAEMHHGVDPDKVTVFENVDMATNSWNEHIFDTIGSHNAKVGDLDLDGFPDIAGKNYEAGDLPLQVDLWWNLGTGPLPVDQWERHIIDETRPWRAVLIDGGDVNGDGLPDIVTGGWWYENPGSPGGLWTRHDIGGELYNMAVLHDLDTDGDLDILGTDGQYSGDFFRWAENDGSASFTFHTNIPRGVGDFLQGARAAQIVPGGNPEVVLSWHDATSTQMYSIPSPATADWSWAEISSTTNNEQIAVGDIDDDGDLDIHLGTQWLRNDGGSWHTVDAFALGDPDSLAEPDRVELADINQDGDLDVVIGAEKAEWVVWGEAPPDPEDPWTEHLIASDILGMSLDVADLDRDGDIDLVVGEHDPQNGDIGRVMIYQNENLGGNWNEFQIDSGLEHHDGTQFVDIDNDGDLDIISIGWEHSRTVLYENKANGGGSGNTPPRAVADTYWLDKGGILPVVAPGVLENDSDADGDPLTAREVSGPVHGTLGLNTDGSFTYEHDGGSAVEDAFTYEASDGQGGTDTATVTLRIRGAGAIDVRVSEPTDDAEERISNGDVARSGVDLELGEDREPQLVGMRFQNVTVPPGANIIRASVEFTADETHSGDTNVTICGQAADDPPAFSGTDGDISNRPRTSACVDWNNVPPWTTIHDTYQSPDLSPIIQEVVNRSGWSAGNALVLIVNGSGRRTAEAFNGEPTMAPKLHVEYGPPGACYTLTTTVDPGGSGAVNADPQPNCDDAGVAKYLQGTQVQLTAQAASGYSFDHWTGSLSGSSNPDSLSMDADRSVTAHFVTGSQVGPLVYVSNTVDDDQVDDSNGNGDGIANCGETIELFVDLLNQGSDAATGVNATLSTSDAYVTWVNSPASTYPDLPAGGTGSNDDDFDLAIDANTPAGHTIQFDLQVTAANGGPWNDSFDLQVSCGGGGAGSVDRQVSHYSDDAEEKISDGDVARSGVDLELGEDREPQLVGMRFQNVTVPRGASITRAYVEFTADETHSGDTDVTICAQAADDPPAFSGTDGDISNRPTTSACVDWNNVPPWTTIHDTYQSPDLSPIIQEVVNRSGWSDGNALVLIVSGSGRRTAEAFDGEPTMAPRLHLEYGGAQTCYALTTAVDPGGSGTVNADPQPNCDDAGVAKYVLGTLVQLTAQAASGFSFDHWTGSLSGSSNPDSLSMDADRSVTAHFVTGSQVGPLVYVSNTVDDDQVDDSNGNGDGIANCGETIELFVDLLNQGSDAATGVNATLSTSDAYVTWVNSPASTYPDLPAGGTGSNDDDFDLAIDANTPAGHTIQFDLQVTAANGGPWNDSFGLQVSCGGGGTGSVDRQVSHYSDDAEERLRSSSVIVKGSDLELVEDTSIQAVGLRFQDVQIPQGATVTDAYLVFYADETHSGDTDLTFHGQAADNALAFSDADGDISDRAVTAAAVDWNNVPPWTAVHDPYQSPDLSPVIQEVVNRSGWSEGNALVIIVTGSGRRVAESYDGQPAMAPSLHVGYTITSR